MPIPSSPADARRRALSCTFAAAALGAMALFGAATPAMAQLEIKLGHVGEPGSLFQVSADEFAKRANAKLGAKAKVVTFGSSQLGGDKEMLQKLKLGTLDMALPSTVMSSEVDLFGVFEMPYLVKDRAHMGASRRKCSGPSSRRRRTRSGLLVLAVWGERLSADHQQQAPDQGCPPT
jgi:TRAP-type C4-dicarboxylate transport system substrate-binding protein